MSVGEQRVGGAIPVLADLVHPQVRIDLARLRAPPGLVARMPRHGAHDRLDVHVGRDRVGEPLAPRHVAVRARHRAPVGRRRRDEVGTPPVRPKRQPLLHPKHQRLPLRREVVAGIAIVQFRDAPVRNNRDAFCIRETGQDLASAGMRLHGLLQVDAGDIEWRRSHRRRCESAAEHRKGDGRPFGSNLHNYPAKRLLQHLEAIRERLGRVIGIRRDLAVRTINQDVEQARAYVGIALALDATR